MADQFDTPTPAGKGDDREFDQYGRYRIPHPQTGKVVPWTRVTTYAKSIADTYALTQWQMRMAVKGLALRPDLLALAAATPVEDKEKLNRVAEDAKEAAAASAGANSGTALHAFTEQIDRGEKPFVPAPWDKDVAAYQATLAGHGVGVGREYIECKTVIPALGVAGTFDRINTYRGGLVIGDLKTGKNLDYGWLEIAIQLALYSRGTHIWDPRTRAFRPMPQVDQDIALVYHLPAGQGRCDIYEVDIAAGWEAAQLCGQVREWRKRRGLARQLQTPAPGLVTTEDLTYLIDTATTVAELERLWTVSTAHGRWTPGHTLAARARKNVLLQQANK